MSDEQNSQMGVFQDAIKWNDQISKSLKNLSAVSADDVDVGATPKTLVLEQDKVTLYHYDPLPDTEVQSGPVIIVYGLVGRYTMVDLQEDRSLVRNLLGRGVDLYVVDWGHPTRADQYLTLDDFVDWYLDDCIERIREISGADQVTILGICEGGTFSVAYAALHPEKVKNLILTITPVDFHGDLQDENEAHGFINLWTRSLEEEDVNRLIKVFGNLPGEIMASVFQMMTPVRTMTKYNIDLLEAASDEERLLNFLRMEKWLADRPHHPGAAAKQWLIELYKENRLVEGTFELSRRRVDLKNLDMPILNVFAKQDHIIPPPCSTALGKYVGTDDYTELALPGGHVGVYVSRKSQGIVGSGVFDWLMDRQ